MTLPDPLWAHVHVSERESAHVWPDGERDDAAWEDCGPTSVVELVRLGHDDAVPHTLAEAEALRHDAGYGPTGGTNAASLAAGVAKRYRWTLPVIRGFDSLWAALAPGFAAAIGGSMGAFPAGSHWRRWDPAFHAGHNVLVARIDDAPRVWWCDPLAPAGAYQGEWMGLDDLRAFVSALPGAGHLVAAIRPKPVVARDAMIVGKGHLDRAEHRPLQNANTKPGTKLYEQAGAAKEFASLPTARQLPYVGPVRDMVAWAMVIVDTALGGNDSLCYVRATDIASLEDLPDPTPFGPELKAKLDELDASLATAQKLAAQAQATATAAQAVITEIRDIVGA